MVSTIGFGITGESDPRWEYGTQPQGNVNYAWLQHMLYHLKPTGRAGIVLANGSMSSSQNSGGDIRRALVEADKVEVMVAMPGQLFFNTQIPACLWFLARQKSVRQGDVLFIDVRKLGAMISRVQIKFSEMIFRGSPTPCMPGGAKSPSIPLCQRGKPKQFPPLKKGGQGGFIRTSPASAAV